MCGAAFPYASFKIECSLKVHAPFPLWQLTAFIMWIEDGSMIISKVFLGGGGVCAYATG